jgi:5-methylcytosine-specific restriction protein A
MPNAPARLCARCRRTSCQCRAKARAVSNRERGTAAERGYDWSWRNPNRTGAADRHLAAEPLCRECQWWKRIVAASLVDHRKPHRGYKHWFWLTDNWQSLCSKCHNCKTARENNTMQKYVICGPPGSGKTTWVKQRAKPGDLVFDADYLMSQLFSTPLHQANDFGHTLVERLRQAVVDWLLNYPDRKAFVIQTDPVSAAETAQWLSAELVTMEKR